MNRRQYKICISVNEILITKVIIDPHYEKKHAESINDELILKLVHTLDGQFFMINDEKYPYFYFEGKKINLNGKHYRLIWLLEEYQDYIGIINAYRE